MLWWTAGRCASAGRATRSRRASGWCTRSWPSATTCPSRRTCASGRSPARRASAARDGAPRGGDARGDGRGDRRAPSLGELNVAQQQLVQIAAAVGERRAHHRLRRADQQPEPARGGAAVRADRPAPGARRDVHLRLAPHAGDLPPVRRRQRAARRPARRHPAHGGADGGGAGAADDRPAAGRVLPAPPDAAPGEELLRVEGLSCPGGSRTSRSRCARARCSGSRGWSARGGRRSRRRSSGWSPARRGGCWWRESRCASARPGEAIRLGIGLVPEDRKRQGLVLGASGLHNTSLPILERLSRLGWIRRAGERALAEDYFGRLRVRAPVVDAAGGRAVRRQPAEGRAGEVAGRALARADAGRADARRGRGRQGRDPRADRRAGRGGSAVLLISSELPELLALSTRILVLRGGRVVGELPRGGATQDGLLRMMAGLGDGTERELAGGDQVPAAEAASPRVAKPPRARSCSGLCAWRSGAGLVSLASATKKTRCRSDSFCFLRPPPAPSLATCAGEGRTERQIAGSEVYTLSRLRGI